MSYKTLNNVRRKCILEAMDDLKTTKTKTSGAQKVLRGLWSSGGHYSWLSAYALRYPQAIVTLKTALSLYGMTDYPIEAPFEFAFPRGSRISKDPRLKQTFVSKSFFSLGESHLAYEGRMIRVYDRERLLIEVFHARNKLGSEVYKSAIASYRSLIRSSDFSVPLFEDYCRQLSFAKKYMSRLFLEVM